MATSRKTSKGRTKSATRSRPASTRAAARTRSAAATAREEERKTPARSRSSASRTRTQKAAASRRSARAKRVAEESRAGFMDEGAEMMEAPRSARGNGSHRRPARRSNNHGINPGQMLSGAGHMLSDAGHGVGTALTATGHYGGTMVRGAREHPLRIFASLLGLGLLAGWMFSRRMMTPTSHMWRPWP